MFRMKGLSLYTFALCFSLLIWMQVVPHVSAAEDLPLIEADDEEAEGEENVELQAISSSSEGGESEVSTVPNDDEEEEEDACGFDPYRKGDTDEVKPCVSDLQPTHPEGDLGTAMGKCSVPLSIWRKTCQAADAVNEHYNKITSAIDPQAKERAIALQQSTSLHEECLEQEGTMSAYCKTCSMRLDPNKFGVLLTCYECQRGASDKSCHHVIKESPKFIVSSTYFELVNLAEDETDKKLNIGPSFGR